MKIPSAAFSTTARCSASLRAVVLARAASEILGVLLCLRRSRRPSRSRSRTRTRPGTRSSARDWPLKNDGAQPPSTNNCPRRATDQRPSEHRAPRRRTRLLQIDQRRVHEAHAERRPPTREIDHRHHRDRVHQARGRAAAMTRGAHRSIRRPLVHDRRPDDRQGERPPRLVRHQAELAHHENHGQGQGLDRVQQQPHRPAEPTRVARPRERSRRHRTCG